MAWQDETKTIIQDILNSMQSPCISGGTLGQIEGSLKTNLELSIATIEKIQEHETQIAELQAGDVSIPIKIWEGTWNSGTLVPSTDAGHISGTGVLADYNVLIFVVKTDEGDSCVYTIPQSSYGVFDSNNYLTLNIRDRYIKFYFSDAETLVYSLTSHTDLVQIWGIK